MVGGSSTSGARRWFSTFILAMALIFPACGDSEDRPAGSADTTTSTEGTITLRTWRGIADRACASWADVYVQSSALSALFGQQITEDPRNLKFASRSQEGVADAVASVYGAVDDKPLPEEESAAAAGAVEALGELEDSAYRESELLREAAGEPLGPVLNEIDAGLKATEAAIEALEAVGAETCVAMLLLDARGLSDLDVDLSASTLRDYRDYEQMLGSAPSP
jgi:hypothetical protein